DQRVVESAAARILDVDERVGALAVADVLRLALFRQVDEDGIARHAIVDAVEAGAAIERIVTFVAAEIVVSDAADERIVAGAAVQGGTVAVAALAIDQVVAAVPVEKIALATAAVDRLALVRTLDHLDISALILAVEADGGEDGREIGIAAVERIERTEIAAEGGDGGAGILVDDADGMGRVEAGVLSVLVHDELDEQIVAVALHVPVVWTAGQHHVVDPLVAGIDDVGAVLGAMEMGFGSGSAVEHVDAEAAGERVVAAGAIEGVVAVVAGDLVGERIAGAADVPAAGEREVL